MEKVKILDIKPHIQDDELIFNVENIEEKPFDQIDNITDDLINLNLQRYLIRKSKEVNVEVLASKIYKK